jgi:hypothetical protein
MDPHKIFILNSDILTFLHEPEDQIALDVGDRHDKNVQKK